MTFLLHHLLQASAARHPDRTAVEDNGLTLTYAELDARSNQLARLLMEIGVRRGDRVGLYLEKSLHAVVAIYGVLKAGAAYVPLDANAPTSRLAYIARNAGVRVLLTGPEKQDRWASLIAEGASAERFVVLNHSDVDASNLPDGSVLTSADIARQAMSPPNIEQVHHDLAYILYTSGSTGDPKGVMLSHLNALTFVDWTVEEFGIVAGDRLSSHAPLHFDLSVFDLFAASKAAAAVVLVPAEASVFPIELARFIADREISVWYSVPSALSMMTLRGGLRREDFPHLRTILFAGEVFPTKYLRRLMALLPHVRFANLYGPTETNVCTWYEVPQLPEEMTEAIPIGIPIPNVECYVVADDGALAAAGEAGELFVRGSTVMKGYWADAERTKKVLISNPFAGELHDDIYRTGDLVRRDLDGNLRFLGRRDSQIKSRGYRIELGDIEAALYAHPDVLECAVIAVPDELVTNRLKAYVVSKEGLERAALVRFLGERLPSYMVPDSFEFLESLPKTSTGKVQRRALVGTVDQRA